MVRTTKKAKDGSPKVPISVLHHKTTNTKTITFSKLFDLNFNIFLKFLFDYDYYTNISDEYFQMLDDDENPIHSLNEYEEELNPKIESFYNNYDRHPVYKGVHSWRFMIILPEHDNNMANICFEKTIEEITPKFKKHIKTLPGDTIFKSKTKYNIVTEETQDESYINEEEYISFGNNYILCIIFSKNKFKNPHTPEINIINVSAHYIDLKTINRKFDFNTGKSVIFDNILSEERKKWYMIYDKDMNSIEKDASRPTNNNSIFSQLDEDLTKHIFKLSKKSKEYTNTQMSGFVNSVIQNAKTTRSR
jgi:hypothetical protein